MAFDKTSAVRGRFETFRDHADSPSARRRGAAGAHLFLYSFMFFASKRSHDISYMPLAVEACLGRINVKKLSSEAE